MKEKNLITKIRQKILEKYSEIHYFKIPDTPYLGGKYRFLVPKPYDFYVVKDGKFYAFEVKVVRRKNRIPIDLLREHQLINLLEVKKNGGLAYILIYIVPHKKLYKIDTEDWDTITKSHNHNSSVNLQVLAKLPIFSEVGFSVF